ncbi:MAG: putative transcriptional regulator of viral defense system [Gammaproteobacteria bacterium]|jgi:predicted transcriptional regulator of viral defense system
MSYEICKLYSVKTSARVDVISMVDELSEAQHGYFTRAQAHDVGVLDAQLTRATSYGQIRRLDHGVYRVAGAGIDGHADLRIAWLRLDPKRRPRVRTKNPTIWVSHQSAAALLGLGTFIPPGHQFISTVRKQLRADDVRVQVRPDGLDSSEWVIRDGMAVTSPLQTLVDLDAVHTDGGHLGAFLRDALDTGAIRTEQVAQITLRTPFQALLEMAEGSSRA